MLTFLPVLITVLCNVSTLTFGLQLGWLAPLQPAFQSNGSSPLGPDAEPLSDDEISWIGSIPGIITIPGAPLFGYTLDKIGRKYSLLLCTAPNIVTYILLIFANNVFLIYVSRIIGGICSCGGLIVGSMYIMEAVHPTLRGTLGGMTAFSINFGIILSYIFGSYTSYLTLNLVSLSFTILFLICFPLIPESPVYLMKNGRWGEAETVYRKVWGEAAINAIELEIEEYKSLFDKSESSLNFIGAVKFLAVDKGARLGMLIVGMVMFVEMFTGFPAVISYAVNIFMESGTIFSPYLAAILLAVFQLVFAFFGAFLIEHLGRKGVLTYCGPVLFLSTFLTSLYLFLRFYLPENDIVQSMTVIPTVTLVVYISACAASYGAVAFVIIPEYFTPESRSTASTILNLWYALLEFIALKLFFPLNGLIRLPGIFAVYSIISLIGVIFIRICMFETKGLGINTIQSKLSGKLE